MLYYSYQQLCPTLQRYLNSLCKDVPVRFCAWCMSLVGFPCALSVLSEDNMKQDPARHGKEALISHTGNKPSPNKPQVM